MVAGCKGRQGYAPLVVLGLVGLVAARSCPLLPALLLVLLLLGQLLVPVLQVLVLPAERLRTPMATP
jgi:hypothetical protein